jgi:hypothetical protein
MVIKVGLKCNGTVYSSDEIVNATTPTTIPPVLAVTPDAELGCFARTVCEEEWLVALRNLWH